MILRSGLFFFKFHIWIHRSIRPDFQSSSCVVFMPQPFRHISLHYQRPSGRRPSTETVSDEVSVKDEDFLPLSYGHRFRHCRSNLFFCPSLVHFPQIFKNTLHAMLKYSQLTADQFVLINSISCQTIFIVIFDIFHGFISGNGNK